MAFEKRAAGNVDEYETGGSSVDTDAEDIKLDVGDEVVGTVKAAYYNEFEGQNFETGAPEQRSVVNLYLEDDEGNQGQVTGYDSSVFGKSLISKFTKKNGNTRVFDDDWEGQKIALAKLEKVSENGYTYYVPGIKRLE